MTKTTDQTQIIEINGVKFSVDLSKATLISELQIGSPVKVLKKRYSDYAIYPGIVCEFVNFQQLPTIQIAYIEHDFSSAELKFCAFNAEQKEIEIVPDTDFLSLDVTQQKLLDLMEKSILKKEEELADMQRKKAYFQQEFGRHFKSALKPTVA